MKGAWDQKKKKYIKKENAKPVKWIHKNQYIVGKFGVIYKGANIPYIKPKEDTSESKN